MGLIEAIMETIVAIFLVIVFFFIVLPQIAIITGFNVWFIWIIGILLMIIIFLSIIKEL
jgi:hypothetical protein|uniref:Uncharacterized protein n=1 Tax=Pleomorphic virus ThalV2 TaxID=3115753 RepID=A0AAT9J7S4_9VIRU